MSALPRELDPRTPDLGGKTGTTDNYADAWFSGFLPSLEATIWIGYPRGEIPMLSVHGIAVSGPTFPATIWKLFMERASYYAPFPKEFPTPKSSPIQKRSRRIPISTSSTVIVGHGPLQRETSWARQWRASITETVFPPAFGPLSLLPLAT